jgi:NADH:ubiquinone oxidoreductase subunit C
MKKVLSQAKKIKADRLVSISCVKEKEGFSLYYHFSNDSDAEMKEMKVSIKEGEEVESIIPIHAHAELFESEATEMYGVKFAGNPSSGKRLFLEEK